MNERAPAASRTNRSGNPGGSGYRAGPLHPLEGGRRCPADRTSADREITNRSAVAGKSVPRATASTPPGSAGSHEDCPANGTEPPIQAQLAGKHVRRRRRGRPAVLLPVSARVRRYERPGAGDPRTSSTAARPPPVSTGGQRPGRGNPHRHLLVVREGGWDVAGTAGCPIATDKTRRAASVSGGGFTYLLWGEKIEIRHFSGTDLARVHLDKPYPSHIWQ